MKEEPDMDVDKKVTLIKAQVYYLCVSFSRNILEEPEDLFQDIVLRLLDYDQIGLMRYRAKQLLTDIYRKSTRRKMDSIDNEVGIKGSYDVSPEKIEELNVIMNGADLDSAEKELLYQRFYLDWSLEEIGNYENRGKSTICVRLQEVIMKIRTSIDT